MAATYSVPKNSTVLPWFQQQNILITSNSNHDHIDLNVERFVNRQIHFGLSDASILISTHTEIWCRHERVQLYCRNPALIPSSLFSEMGETWVSIQYLVKNSILVGLGTQASLSDKRLSRDRVGLFCKMDQTVVSTFVRHCKALRYSLQFTFHLKIIDRFKKCNLHHWMLHWVGDTEYSHS